MDHPARAAGSPCQGTPTRLSDIAVRTCDPCACPAVSRRQRKYPATSHFGRVEYQTTIGRKSWRLVLYGVSHRKFLRQSDVQHLDLKQVITARDVGEQTAVRAHPWTDVVGSIECHPLPFAAGRRHP